MGIYSSGSKWKNLAKGALASAQALEDQQRDVEFRRSLLSNIRQHRIAQAQLSLMNYSDSYTSSSAAGASANISSTLAGEMGYSYETSQRMEDIQDYQEKAKEYMKKYAKQQKSKASAFAVTGALAGAALGGLGAGLVSGGMSATSGALVGATIGQGVGQMLSNTGQFDTGLQNVIGGLGQMYRMSQLQSSTTPQTYELTSIDPVTKQPIPGSTIQTTATKLSNFWS